MHSHTEPTYNNNHQALFSATVPKTINVRYKLSTNTNQEEIVQQVEPQQFATECGMTQWTETVFIDPTMSYAFGQEIFPGQKLNTEKLNKIINSSTEQLPHLVIANMGHSLGYGVYTTAKIAKNEFVAIYAGVEMPENKDIPAENQSEYLFGFENNIGKQLGTVDAKYHGNISRFIQHFPFTKDKIALQKSTDRNYIFNDEKTTSSVLTANLLAVPFYYNNHSVTVFAALRDIKENEWLGIDYGHYWWNTHRHPLLIDASGQFIKDTEYQINKWLCKITIENIIYAGVELDKEDIRKYHQTPLSINFDHEGFIGKALINPQDFARAFKSTPSTSPYIYIEKPSQITFIEHPENKKIPSNDQEKKETIVTPTKFTGGFFLSKAEKIQRELARILQAYPTVSCHYYSKQDTVVIMHNDITLIEDISAYLKTHKFFIKSGHHEKTKMPMLYVINPQIKNFDQTPPISLHQMESDIKVKI